MKITEIIDEENEYITLNDKQAKQLIEYLLKIGKDVVEEEEE